MQAFICATLAGPTLAETVSCDLDGVPLRFEIDRNQFVAPQDPNDPPRRKITTVRMGAAQFPAEPFVIGNVRGFWAEGQSGANVMFSMQPDGSAIYADARMGNKLSGRCEVMQ